MKNIIILLIVFLNFSCKSQIDQGDVFLDKFININEFPSSNFFLKKEIIIPNDTVSSELLKNKFCFPINQIKYTNTLSEKKYFYYGKYKLDENHYIVSIKVFYNQHESKVISFTYDNTKKTVTSCIELMSSDLLESISSHYKSDKLITINSYKRIPNGLDPPPGKEFIEKKMVKTYIINRNFEFEEDTPDVLDMQ